MSHPKLPSPQMLAMLRSLRDYDDYGHHLRGAAQHGGASGTLCALIHRGWVSSSDRCRIALTAAGRDVLSKYEPKS
jgi:hypothetical protein